MIDALDQFPCSRAPLECDSRLSEGFRRFSRNSGRGASSAISFQGQRGRERGTFPPTRSGSRWTQRSKKAFRKGNVERPFPLTIPKWLLRSQQLLGLRFDMHGRCAPQICSRHRREQGCRAPGISLRYCGRQNFRCSIFSTPVLLRSMATPFLYRFPVQRPLPRHSTNRAGS